jgi:hypothetical protein
MLMRPEATFELARRVQINDATLGEVFTFCSGLYFRGKLAYAREFARPPAGLPGVHVITPSRGLALADSFVGLQDLREFSGVNVDTKEPRFTEPLQASTRILAAAQDCEVVLLGSIATGKYAESLLPLLGERLLFPSEFVGRGDMSRGGLMLRSVAAGVELDYIPLAGAVRTGTRPKKLGPVIRPEVAH